MILSSPSISLYHCNNNHQWIARLLRYVDGSRCLQCDSSHRRHAHLKGLYSAWAYLILEGVKQPGFWFEDGEAWICQGIA